jgi:hypothetical protein
MRLEKICGRVKDNKKEEEGDEVDDSFEELGNDNEEEGVDVNNSFVKPGNALCKFFGGNVVIPVLPAASSSTNKSKPKPIPGKKTWVNI